MHNPVIDQIPKEVRESITLIKYEIAYNPANKKVHAVLGLKKSIREQVFRTYTGYSGINEIFKYATQYV
jgi:hypothetical protein